MREGQRRIDRRLQSVTESNARCSVTGRPGATASTDADQVEVQSPATREAGHRAVDAQFGKVGECPLQRDELTRAGDAEAVALAHHDAKRQGRGGDDPADQIERRGQPVALDFTDDFQPIRAPASASSASATDWTMTSRRMGVLSFSFQPG